jgi:hypothetical protein
VPAELLRFAGGALPDHDVDKGGTAEVHRFVVGALQALWVLDIEPLAPNASIIRSYRAP